MDQPGSALAYKEALSLMIAQRRPSHYLVAGGADLEALTNSHLRMLAQAGAITPAARCGHRREAASGDGLGRAVGAPTTFVTRKASNAIRNHLANMLGDNAHVQPRPPRPERGQHARRAGADRRHQGAARAARSGSGEAAGLTGKGMLGNGDPANVVYSFTLLEKGEQPTCCACRRITSTSRWTSTKAPSWTSVPPPSCARW
jgi:hypothetical protein